MKDLAVAMLLLVALAGCNRSGRVLEDPFNQRHLIQPPGTHSIAPPVVILPGQDGAAQPGPSPDGRSSGGASGGSGTRASGTYYQGTSQPVQRNAVSPDDDWKPVSSQSGTARLASFETPLESSAKSSAIDSEGWEADTSGVSVRKPLTEFDQPDSPIRIIEPDGLGAVTYGETSSQGAAAGDLQFPTTTVTRSTVSSPSEPIKTPVKNRLFHNASWAKPGDQPAEEKRLSEPTGAAPLRRPMPLIDPADDLQWRPSR